MRILLVLALSAGVSPVDFHPQQGPAQGLDALAAIAADADVMGVGEAVHLSGGLERARGELAWHAVQAWGYRSVALEVDWAEGRAVDDQLQACRQEPVDVVVPNDDMYTGVAPLLKQLCGWNHAHPDDAVRFIGFDLQSVWVHRDRIEAALGARDPELRRCHGTQADSKQALQEWGRANGYPLPTVEDHTACLARLDALQVQVDDPDLVQAIASMRVKELSAWAHMVEHDLGEAYRIREEGMLAVLHLERARLGDPRVVLLAHNEHVARRSDKYRPLGAMLHDDPAISYVNVAVGGFHVETRLGAAYDLDEPGPKSVQAEWKALGHPVLLVDQRGQGEPHDVLLYVVDSPRE
jgi:erythromycin esterase-like protein